MIIFFAHFLLISDTKSLFLNLVPGCPVSVKLNNYLWTCFSLKIELLGFPNCQKRTCLCKFSSKCSFIDLFIIACQDSPHQHQCLSSFLGILVLFYVLLVRSASFFHCTRQLKLLKGC